MSQSSNNIFAGIGNKNTKSNNASVAPGVVEGGGGGTSLYETAFNVVNLTDGSWTLYDPDSLIQSVTFSAGYNTVTWNALSVASLNYNWAAGGEHRAPRWYKNNIIDGNQVSSIDTNVFTSLLEIDQTVNEFNQAVLMGIAVEPATTDLFTVDASGGYVIKDGPPSSPAYPSWGTHQYSSATTGDSMPSPTMAFAPLCAVETKLVLVYLSIATAPTTGPTGLDPVIVIKLFSTTARLLILTLCLVLV
jgi:hypothetical protein